MRSPLRLSRYLAVAIALIALAVVPIALGHSHASQDGDRIGVPGRDASGSAPQCPLCRLSSHQADSPVPPPDATHAFTATHSVETLVGIALDIQVLPSGSRAPPALV